MLRHLPQHQLQGRLEGVPGDAVRQPRSLAAVLGAGDLRRGPVPGSQVVSPPRLLAPAPRLPPLVGCGLSQPLHSLPPGKQTRQNAQLWQSGLHHQCH